MKEYLFELLPYAAPIITAIGAYKWDWMMKKLNINQKEAAVEKSSLENIEKNFKLYQSIIDDLSQNYKTRLEEFESNFEDTMKRLKVEIDELREVNKQLEQMVQEQRQLIETLR